MIGWFRTNFTETKLKETFNLMIKTSINDDRVLHHQKKRLI